jgi:hypothetical protein
MEVGQVWQLSVHLGPLDDHLGFGAGSIAGLVAVPADVLGVVTQREVRDSGAVVGLGADLIAGIGNDIRELLLVLIGSTRCRVNKLEPEIGGRYLARGSVFFGAILDQLTGPARSVTIAADARPDGGVGR